MRRFHFYIDDDRHAVPTELTVEVATEARARELAEQLLAQSAHHLGVEVCENGERILGLGAFAHRTICGLRAHRRRPGGRPARHAPPALRAWLELLPVRLLGHGGPRLG
jgi:hypothetical protein